MLFTSSIPARIFKTSFLAFVQLWLLSTEAQRAVLTKQGKTGRRTDGSNLSRDFMSIFCIAWKTSGLTDISFFFILLIFFRQLQLKADMLKFRRDCRYKNILLIYFLFICILYGQMTVFYFKQELFLFCTVDLLE